MSLPPERISVKRRRQDEPVDTLILEQGLVHDKKRRFTDFYFQRVRRDQVDHTSTQHQNSAKSPSVAASNTARDYKSYGIPSVKASAPGDEVKDFIKYKAAHQSKIERTEQVMTEVTVPQKSLPPKGESAINDRKGVLPARRFHLTSDLSSALKPSQTGGIRRHRINLRPPLATFVERRNAPPSTGKSIHKRPPVDSIVELKDTSTADDNEQQLSEAAINKRTKVNTFLKLPPSATKSGKSIRDDPKTWDQDSDQLANELAALAFDIDPADAMEPPQVVVDTRPPEPVTPQAESTKNDAMSLDGDEDFVFETYVRVKHDTGAAFLTDRPTSEIGVLVIDNENEDLWEKYIHSDDDDDEWDEEDEDSNAEDNPRNEYPDEEVSTDDEFGRNAYKYRRNASDDEQFDEDNEHW